MAVIIWQLDLQLLVQSLSITTKSEFESHSWQGVLDTTLCDKDLQHVCKKCSVPLIFLDVSFINRRVMLALFYSYLTEMLIFNGGSFYL
jgi:hypothetical protein